MQHVYTTSHFVWYVMHRLEKKKKNKQKPNVFRKISGQLPIGCNTQYKKACFLQHLMNAASSLTLNWLMSMLT